MKLGLRKQILYPTLAVVTLSMAVLSWRSYSSAREALVSTLTEQMRQVSANAIGQVENWFLGLQKDLEMLAGEKTVVQAVADSPAGVEARPAACADLVRMVQTYGHYDRLNLANAKGLAIAASDPRNVNKLDISDRPYFKEAMSGKTVVSEVVESKTTGTQAVMVAAPVREGNQVAGVVFGVVSMDNVKRMFIEPTKVLQTGYIFFHEQGGRIVAHPDASLVMKVSLKDRDWGQEVLRRRNGVIEFNNDGVARLAAFNAGKSLAWGVVVNVPLAELLAPVNRIGRQNLVLCVLALVLTGGVVYWVTRSIVTPVNRMVAELRQSASQVSAGANQISSASQSLASGAGEQAASLEETSSALEEMAGMTRQNATHAQNAKELSNQTRAAADHGAADMRQMSGAMDSIKASSDDIAKIIKTIDEIAFQTNILALNAAVEAARAGEAGMGFAVVADEVRNLAQRSAHAAKETAAKIEAAIANSSQGVEICAKVREGLEDIVAKARQMDELVGQIASASAEQNQGIDQVNRAVSQMDKVTQANAANAEESAAAARSLNEQADALDRLVAGLVVLAEGESARTGQRPSDIPASSSTREPSARPNRHEPAREPESYVSRSV